MTQRKLEITPAWLPVEAWEAYLEHRRKLRKPLTAYGEKLAIGRLADLREHGHDPLKVLNEAILMGWQGLWPNERTREDVKGGDTTDKSSSGMHLRRLPNTAKTVPVAAGGSHPAENTHDDMSDEMWKRGQERYRIAREFEDKRSKGEIPRDMDIMEWKRSIAK